MTQPTYDLVEFRFENDDGDENTRTFAAGLNATLDLQTGTGNKKSIRVQIHNDNNKVSNVTWQWEYNNTTQATGWNNITTGSNHIRAVASNNAGVTEGDSLNNNLTTRGSFDPDGNITVDGLGTTYNHGSGTYAENSLVFYVVTANVNDNDAIQIRPYSSGDGYTVTYTNTPNITVDKPPATVTVNALTLASSPPALTDVIPGAVSITVNELTLASSAQTISVSIPIMVDTLSLFGLTGPYINSVLTTQAANLLAYWPLAETTGTTADNAEGTSARDGTFARNISTMGTSTGIGDGNTAPDFDGTNDHVDIYSSSLDGVWDGNSFTISAWFKVSGSGVWTDLTERRVINLWSNGLNLTTLYKSNTSNRFSFQFAGGGTFDSVHVDSVTDTGWVHVALTVDTTLDEMKAYWNGSQIGSTQTDLGTWSGVLNSNQCNIGSETITPTAAWDGYLAHVSLWDTVLSKDWIRRLSTPLEGLAVDSITPIYVPYPINPWRELQFLVVR